MRLTESQIAYLYVINNLEKPTITTVAEKLGFSKPSVVKAFTNLSNLGLLEYTKKNISLTEIGKMYANNYNTRKELIEIFLIDILKVEKEQAIKDADKMMINISCRTMASLTKYLEETLTKKSSEKDHNWACELQIVDTKNKKS